jgi:hypothetical protein
MNFFTAKMALAAAVIFGAMLAPQAPAKAAFDAFLFFPGDQSIVVDGPSLDYFFNAADNNQLHLDFNLPDPAATYRLYVENNGSPIGFSVTTALSPSPSESISFNFPATPSFFPMEIR